MKQIKANRQARKDRAEQDQQHQSPKPHADKSLYKSFQRYAPLTAKQSLAEKHYNSKEQNITALVGSAGTGKTAWGLNLAYRDLVAGDCERVLFIRNAVSSREIGHLPGNETDKDGPYMCNVKSMTNEMFQRGDAYEILSNPKNGILKAGCATFMQGVTWDNCRVIVDEVENLNWQELYMLTTRMGKNCKLIICGDTQQTFLNGKHDYSQLPEYISVLEIMPSAEIVTFVTSDIVRSDIVKEFIESIEKLSQMVDRDPEYMDD